MPKADETKLRLSSVVIIKRVEQLGASDQNVKNPFRYGEVLIYPNTGESVRKSVKQMGFFFTAYPAKGSTAAPKLTIEVLQNGKSIGQTSVASLSAADATGRIQYASALPLDNFQPGAYELRVSVRDERGAVTRSAKFIIEP